MTNSYNEEIGLPKIGEAVNLLSIIDRNNPDYNQFKTPVQPALRQYELDEISGDDLSWNPLKVTIHKGVKSLIDNVSLYKVCPLFSEEKGFRLCPDMLGKYGDTYYQELEKTFGIQLKNESYYIVFEVSRIKAEGTHEVTVQPSRTYFNRDWHLTDTWKAKSRKLRPGKRIQYNDEHDAIISVTKSQKYVESFYEYGTHFISAIEVGNKLLQVIELKPHISKQTYEYWSDLRDGKAVSGTEALYFKFFTGLDFAEKVGNIVSFGNDSELIHTINEGLWDDTNSISGKSLMALFNFDKKLVDALNTRFTSIIPIKIELTSLARFMEYFRAMNFERILKGALIQRWGTAVQLPIKRMNNTLKRIDLTVINESCSFSIGKHNFIYGDTIDEQELNTNRQTKETINSCHRVTSLHNTINLTEGYTHILTQLLDTNLLSNEASSILLSNSSFDSNIITCQQMSGILILKNQDGTKQDTVVNGLRFSTIKEENDTGLKIFIKDDIHKMDSKTTIALLPCIQITLTKIQAALASNTITLRQREEAVSFAQWIATLLPVDSGIDKVTKMHLFAMHLSKVASSKYNYVTIFDNEILSISHAFFDQITSMVLHPEFNLTNQSIVSKKDIASISISEIRAHKRKLTSFYLLFLNKLHVSLKDKIDEVDLSFDLTKDKLFKEVQKLKIIFDKDGITSSSKVLFDGIIAGIKGLPFEYNNEELRDNYKDETVCIASDFANHENRYYELFQQIDSIKTICNDLSSGTIEYDSNTLLKLPESQHKILPEPFEITNMHKTLLNSGVKTVKENEIHMLLSLWDKFEKERIRNLTSKKIFYTVFLELNYFSIISEDAVCSRSTPGKEHNFDLEHAIISSILKKIVAIQEDSVSFINAYIPENLKKTNDTSITSLNTLITTCFSEKSYVS